MKSTNELKKIKNVISGITYGIKTKKGIRPSVNKNSLKKGFNKPITNKLIANHIKNKDTLYYYGNEKQNQTLVMIDIDVNKKNKKGSKKGAIEFANYINNNVFKTYYETSTNGEGIHSYFILEKENYTAKKVNEILKKFQNFLQKKSKEINADIELVEIKGTLFEIEYKNKEIENIKYGMLGKIPRKINNVFEIEKIKIEDIKNKFNVENIKFKKNGSITEKHISKNELKKLNYYEKIAMELIGEEKIKAGKFAVTIRDIAISLMFLKFLKENKNKDNTLPTKRIQNLWKAVYRCGDIDRGWNHHRWKEIRNMLSKKGLIEWIDNRYQIKNNEIEGIACKWEISQKMYMYLKKVAEKEEASFVDTCITNKLTSKQAIEQKDIKNNTYLREIINFNKNKELLSCFPKKIKEILFEYCYKTPKLSLILKENKTLFYKEAYGYIKNQFCAV